LPNKKFNKNSNDVIAKRMRFLKKFLECLLKSRLFRGNEILYKFLTIEDYLEFSEYKKTFKTNKPMEIIEYSNLEGLIPLKITPNDVENAEKIRKNLTLHNTLLNKLKLSFDHLNMCCDNVSKAFKDVSELFALLTKASEATNEVIIKLQ
jgi:hypothetical protein